MGEESVMSATSLRVAVRLLGACVLCVHAVAQGVQPPPSGSREHDDRWVPPTDEPVLGEQLSPGSDMCLGYAWEPTIAVNPIDPKVVAVAQGSSVSISFDGGQMFSQTLTTTLQPGLCPGGDPSLGFDSQQRLFLIHLARPQDAAGNCPGPIALGRDVFITRWQRAGNSYVPSLGPVDVTALAAHGFPQNADKPWLAVDSRAGHPFSDRLYVVWSDIDQVPWQVWTTYSTDGGATWSAALQLSGGAEGPLVWPTHNTVAPNHDVYVAYHSQTGFQDGAPDYDVPDGATGQVIVHRSTTGGAAYAKTATNPFDPGECDMTWNVQHKTGAIPNASFWLLGSIQPWILADPLQAGRIYVVANDDPDDAFTSVSDYADVFVARSDDSGATWTAPMRVDDGPGTTFAVMPTAAIDPIGGALAVIWYDNRVLTPGASGDWLLDLRLAYSFDGGTSWLPSVDVNDGLFDPGLSTSCRFCCTAMDACFGQAMTLRIGEYNGVAFGECAAHMVWADNQTCGGDGTLLDVYYDKDPEAGGDLTPPSLTCPADVAVGCNDPTNPNATGFATAVDDCDLDPSVSWVDEILPGNCPPSTVLHTIRRIWSATDQAGNLATCEQLISVVDFDPPVIHVPADLVLMGNTQGCVPSSHPQVQAWAAQISAADDCSQATVSFNLPAVFPGDCFPGRTTDVIVTGQDACGNSDFAVAHVTVIVAAGAGTPYCFGDGSGTACPCANVGLGGHGCNVAQATGGVCLTLQDFMPNGVGGGTATALGTNFGLNGMPGVVLIRSTMRQNGGLGTVFGDGLLCVAPPVVRIRSGLVHDGKVALAITHGAGQGRFDYQLWFRNQPIAFCDPAAAYNLSNAVEVTWP
jgi:hypothetical protein